MSELNLSDNMDSGITKLINDGDIPSIKRNTSSKSVASNLESSRIKTPVSDTVKKLQSEREVFPTKEETAKTTTVEEASDNSTATKVINVNNKVLGMKPLTLGLVIIGIGVAGYFAYKKFKKQ